MQVEIQKTQQQPVLINLPRRDDYLPKVLKHINIINYHYVTQVAQATFRDKRAKNESPDSLTHIVEKKTGVTWQTSRLSDAT